MGVQYERCADTDGQPVFRKFITHGETDRFLAEAAGLKALAATATVCTPAVRRVSARELVTSLIEQGLARAGCWEELGCQLGRMHGIEQPGFGFTGDNYCGLTPQPNSSCSDGHAFFAEHRLIYQAEMARQAGLLESSDLTAVEAVCRRLLELLPGQPPVLLHGDLWRGNVLFDKQGRAVLIDPACYWGWAETDIAMTTMFGGFPEAFYQAWAETAAPEPGWRDRLPLYNLYHLLNHLNLFGRSYYSEVMAVLRRYA